MSGVLDLVREDLRLADLPFILMTSHLYAHVQSSQAAGFDSLLPKPYSPEDLVEQVKAEIRPYMSNAAQLDVPLLVEVGVGSNWDEAH